MRGIRAVLVGPRPCSSSAESSTSRSCLFATEELEAGDAGFAVSRRCRPRLRRGVAGRLGGGRPGPPEDASFSGIALVGFGFCLRLCAQRSLVALVTLSHWPASATACPGPRATIVQETVWTICYGRAFGVKDAWQPGLSALRSSPPERPSPRSITRDAHSRGRCGRPARLVAIASSLLARGRTSRRRRCSANAVGGANGERRALGDGRGHEESADVVGGGDSGRPARRPRQCADDGRIELRSGVVTSSATAA